MPDLRERAAKQFAETWKNRGYEKGDSQPFWITLLTDVFGVSNVADYIEFEDQVHIDHTSFIDGYIPSTKVLIEQKSLGKSLSAAIRQSDGSYLTPFQQAKRYITELPVSRHPRWVVTCNFAEFYVYDMEQPQGEPEIIKLADLEREYYRLSFLVDSANEHIQREMEISIKAGEVVGLLYDAFLKQYREPENPDTLKSLNKLCVRLVFCLYAEDAGIFGHRLMFHDYMAQFSTRDMRNGLKNLFKVLNQKPEERDSYLPQDDPLLAAFPYVNGGLFSGDDIEIPPFTDEIKELLLTQASADFDWAEISPTIFGAVFESTLNPETRRAGGMHYTSIDNIHKVIDPLFLNSLKKELEEIKEIAILRTRNQKLKAFQDKLARLKFLDPAAGSGNFLTESYLSIRKLENEVIRMLADNSIALAWEDLNPIKVSIGQFYGIEINDFAVRVAQTALWIAESQMLEKTKETLHIDIDFLPLKNYERNIVEGNALTTDWETIVPKAELSYIMGNPPFRGTKQQSASQKEDMKIAFFNNPRYKKLDYVAAWYKKACDFIIGTRILCAFVSTNSIVQGEMVDILWKQLFEDYKCRFNFAYTTFRWDSEASLTAAVHCVILGFSVGFEQRRKFVVSSGVQKEYQTINAYLMDAPPIFIEKRQRPLSNLPPMTKGAQLIDDGNYVFETKDEYLDFIAREPKAEQYIKRYYNASNFLNQKEEMYCLYLENCTPAELHDMPKVLERVSKVRAFREASTAPSVYGIKDTPSHYFIASVPQTKRIIVPVVSSENRKFIPIGFSDEDAVYTNALNYIENADLFLFGLLSSNVHNAWMRAFAGRLKSDYRYSKDLVYNTFPVPYISNEKRLKIEKTAQEILDARAKYSDSSLAVLYDNNTMPPELINAHHRNNYAVMDAYGFWGRLNTESACVAELMKMYQALTAR